MPKRDWKEFSKQRLEGRIVKVRGEYKVEVEVAELPGESVYFDVVSMFELNDSLIDCLVIGDVNNKGFNILILSTNKDSIYVRG